MASAGRTVAFVAAHLAACVPVHRRTVVAESVLSRTETAGDVADVAWTGSVRAGERAFEIRVAGEQQCRRVAENQIVRRTKIERSPDGVMLGASIATGFILATVGGVFLYDHRDAASDDGPLLYRGDLDVGRGTGIALLATGALSLSLAVIAGIRSRDESTANATPSVRRVPTSGTLACGAAPATGVQITLKLGELALPGGTTGAAGELAIPYVALPEALVSAETATLRVTATTATGDFVVGDVPMELPRRVRLAAAWRDASAGGDPDRFEHYAQLDRVRGAEALDRARQLRIARVKATLAARDATAADAELRALRQRHATGQDLDALTLQLDALRDELQAEQRAQQRESVLRALGSAVAAVQGGAASPEAFQLARAQLEQARGSYPDEPRVAELAAAFDVARGARVNALLADSKRHLRQSAFELARRAARDAELVAPGDAAAQRALKAVDDRELSAIIRDARQALAAGRVDDAVRAIDRGVAISPDDPRLARLIRDVHARAVRVRDREGAAKVRARDARIRAELAAVQKATGAGDFETARRAVADGRRNHGEDPRWTAALTRVDKAELDAEIRRAKQALARKRLEDAKTHVDRAFALGPEDPRLVPLITKIRAMSRARAAEPSKEQRP